MKDKPKKAIFILVGGVGNQLFVYAAGLYYQAISGVQVIFDLSEVNHGTTAHGSSISAFNVDGIFQSSAANRKARHLIKTLLKVKPLRWVFRNQVYESPSLGYDPFLESSSSTKYFEGYFQTFKYFQHTKVLEKFKAISLRESSDWFKGQRASIRNLNVLAVHIRRGDYLDHKSDLGVLSLDYYIGAVLEEVQQTPGTYSAIFIFSDAIEFVREKLNLEQAGLPITYVTQPRESTAEEALILISEARGLIASNSTFSWWAGALGNPDKKVIYPDPWFRGIEDPSNLIPQTWLPRGAIWEA